MQAQVGGEGNEGRKGFYWKVGFIHGRRGRGEGEKTYHTTGEREENAQRIQRRHDDPAERGDEAGREADEGDDEEPDAEEDIVVCRGGGAAVDLGCDEVAREAEDEDREEDLCGW